MLQATQENILIQQAEEAEKITSASNRFHKSYKDQFAGLYNISLFGRFFFPILSILLGVTCIAYLIQNALPFIYACFALAGIILIVIEYAKYWSLTSIFEIKYSGSKKISGLIIFSICLHIGSILLSVLGAKELYERTDTKTMSIIDTYKVLKDSVNVNFDTKVSIIKSEIDTLKLKARRQWNGINTPEQYRIITQLNSQIETLENNRTNVLSELKKEEKDNVNTSAAKSGFNIIFFMVLAFCIEIFIVLVNFFIVHYDYKIEKTKEILLQNLQIPDVSNMKKQFANYQTLLMSLQEKEAPKMLNKSAKNEIAFSVQSIENVNSYNVSDRLKKLSENSEIVKLIYENKMQNNDRLSNYEIKILQENIKSDIASSSTHIRNIFNIIKAVGDEKVREIL